MNRDNYEMDMLRLIASAYMKKPPERYFDITKKLGKPQKQDNRNSQEMMQDLIDHGKNKTAP